MGSSHEREVEPTRAEELRLRKYFAAHIASKVLSLLTVGATLTGCGIGGIFPRYSPPASAGSSERPRPTKTSPTSEVIIFDSESPQASASPSDQTDQLSANQKKCLELVRDAESLQRLKNELAVYAMRNIVADRQAPGGVVVVGCDTQTLVSVPFGKETYSSGAKVTEHTRYDISSSTKPFTALGIIKSAAEGNLELNRPVGDDLPEYSKGAKADISLSELLQHRAGIVDGRYSEIMNGSTDPDQIKQNIVNWPVTKSKIGKYEYSNVGFSVAGIAASHQLGEPLTEVIEKSIFEPLGMSDTTYTPEGDCAPTTSDYDSTVYECDLQDRLGRPMQGETYHTGIFTSGHDMAIFMKELANIQNGNSSIVPKSAFETMIDRSSPGYGMGFRINNKDVKTVALLSNKMSSEAFGHTGWNGTMFTYDPATSLWTVFLSNATYKQNLKPMEYRLDKFSDLRRGVNDIAVDAWEAQDR